MSSPTHYDAIQDLVPNAEVGVTTKGDQVIIHWQDEREQPTEEAIQARLSELQADYESKQYQRDRLQEYPSIQECIHAILDDDLEALQAKRTAVKAKYPKPE